jgi:hypothetical protein
MSQIFLSYARSDDEPFVKQLYEDLTKNGIKVWWDREKMESRGRTFLQELRDAIEESDQLIAVVGPKAVTSDYVKVEWEHALLFAKGVIPILRLGDYDLLKEDKLKDLGLSSELSKLHGPDFRKERQYNEALQELLRLLEKPLPKLGQFLTSIPSLPPNHLPRTEYLDRLKETVLADIERPVVITSKKQITALQGMGGTGKSVLAATFARTIKNRRAFNHGILWVTIGLEKPDIIGAMRLVGTAFGDEPANYSSHKEAESSLTKVLSDKICLIVLDDIWKVSDITPFINALGPRCRLLFTTRNEDVVTSIEAQECKVEMLDESDSLKLMAEWCKKDTNSLPPEAKGVAKECGYLPLALSMCGAMAKSGTAWSDILEALQEADLEFIEAQLPNYQNSEYFGLVKVFYVSIEFLSSEDPDAVKRYQELAILPADESVPEATLATLWAYTGNVKKRNSGKLLTKLKDRALLRFEGEAPNRLISLHDLQLDYLRAIADDLPCLHNQLLEAYSKECGNKWSAGPADGYFFEHLAYHLVGAGRKEELRKLLFDFNWMKLKLNATDVHFLIKDYDFFSEDYPVEMVKGAIQLSTNALSKNKNQLDGQLLGRLEYFSETEIMSLKRHIRERKSGIRLLPLTGNLTPPGGPLLRTLEGHSDRVRAVSITPDGNLAVSASFDKTLKVWDIKTGKEVHTLEGHSYSVCAVSVTPDGNYAVSASDDETLKVWDIKTGKKFPALIGHSSYVSGICVTPDGNFAVSASYDKTLKVWDTKTGKEVHTLTGHSDQITEVCITPNGNYAVSASLDKTLKVWDIKTGTEVRTLTGHSDRITTVCVTSDGNYAVSASEDRTLKVWDLKTGKEISTFSGDSPFFKVAFSPDGTIVVAGEASGRVHFLQFERESEH